MAKKTEQVTFSGKGSWFNGLIHGDQEYSNWNVKLHFNNDSYNKFMKLKEKTGETEGIMNEVKKDDDGYFHSFKRPFTKNFGKGDEPLPPPIILDHNNQPWDRSKGIGNGSDITVICDLYEFRNRRTRKPGRAIRLNAVRVENAVPYTLDSFTDKQKDQIKGIEQAPHYWTD